MEVLQERQAVPQPRKDGELPLEGVLPEEQVEGGHVVYFAYMEGGCGHATILLSFATTLQRDNVMELQRQQKIRQI